MARGEVGAEHLEAVAHVQAVIALGVIAHDVDGGLAAVADLSDHHAGVVFVGQRAHAFQEGDVLGLVLGMDVALETIGFRALVVGIGRVVAQLGVVEVVVDRVQAEPVHAAFQPEAHRVQQGVLDRGVPHVQVGLLDQEVVQVVLAAARLPLPRGAAEDGGPVAGRGAVGLGVGPDIPVGLGVGAVAAALLEPGMLVAGMADDLVDDDLQAQGVRAGDHGVEIGHAAEQRVDAGIVGHVIAHVLLRRGEVGRQPDRIHTKARHMVQPARDARQVADAVAVTVLKTAGIDLIDHRVAPPFRHHRYLSGKSCRRG